MSSLDCFLKWLMVFIFDFALPELVHSLIVATRLSVTLSDYNTPYEVSLDIDDILSGFVTRKSGVLSVLFQYSEPETSPSISVEALQVWMSNAHCLVPNQIRFS